MGSVRVVTNEAGAVVRRHDYLPFGQEWAGTPGEASPKMFTGQERDVETGLDYFGARYYRAEIGRFTTVDPAGVNPLKLVNPQRFNRYAYANNNPLKFIDPDGRDAIVFNFSQGAVVGGVPLGHSGIAAVASNGVVTFSHLTQEGGGLIGKPYVSISKLVAHVEFDNNGNPTPQSLSAVAHEAGTLVNAVAGSVQLAYFKTSPTETAALTAWIMQSKTEWQDRPGALYVAVGRNCGNYVRSGMANVRRVRYLTAPGVSLPNLDILLFRMLADALFKQKATVTTEITSFRPADAQNR